MVGAGSKSSPIQSDRGPAGGVLGESQKTFALRQWLHDQQTELLVAWTTTIEQLVKREGGSIEINELLKRLPRAHRPPGGRRVVGLLVDEFMEPSCRLIMDQETGKTLVVTGDLLR
jgi:hypothetical protein